MADGTRPFSTDDEDRWRATDGSTPPALCYAADASGRSLLVSIRSRSHVLMRSLDFWARTSCSEVTAGDLGRILAPLAREVYELVEETVEVLKAEGRPRS